MNLKKWNLNKKITLLINGIEMDFSNSFSFQDHTSNFSSFTFNDVIPKDKNNYKDIIKVWEYGDEFQIGEIYSDQELIFFGIVNATGRLSLFPNSPKTKSIQIVDFRKWLSLKKPVELLFFKTSPQKIVTELIEKMGEEKIIVGRLDFTNNENINAYSTYGKSPYQVLKEIIAKQTDSLLYFEITKDKKISINFKSEETLKEEEKITIDLENVNSLNDYKILDIELESNIDSYANIINYESENIVSNILKQEIIAISGSENLTTFNNVGKIDNTKNNIFIQKGSEKHSLVVLNNDRYTDGKHYDVLYSTGKNTIKVNKKWLDGGYSLYFSYYPKLKNAVQLVNWEEREKIAQLTKTAGDVYKYEKYNDISDLNDLLRLCKGDLNLSSIVEKKIIITCEVPIWNVGETLFIKSKNENVSGLYLVIEATGEIIGSTINGNQNNFIMPKFTYMLKNSKNTNSLVNQFDNQNFKKNPAIDENSVFETSQNIDVNVFVNIETELNEAKDEDATITIYN